MTSETAVVSAEDERLLRRTFTLAKLARNQGNGPYGALCADAHGRVVAEGENSERESKADFSCHAEMNALREASREFPVSALADFTLYASAEPCPMCSAAVALAGVKRIVYGASVARAAEALGAPVGVGCRAVLQLLAAPVDVLGPQLEDEALQVLV